MKFVTRASALAVAACLATPAQAGVLTKSAVGCGTPALTQPFKPWFDHAHYKLVDNGTFENGADGWTLTDWFENVYLSQAGPENYDKLPKHEIPWTDPSVEEALNSQDFLGELMRFFGKGGE